MLEMLAKLRSIFVFMAKKRSRRKSVYPLAFSAASSEAVSMQISMFMIQFPLYKDLSARALLCNLLQKWKFSSLNIIKINKLV